MSVTANWTWFVPWADNITNAYFSCSLLILSILSFYFILKDKDKDKHVLWFLYVLTVFTFIFSFGVNLPLFKYLPLAKSLVPGLQSPTPEQILKRVDLLGRQQQM